VDEHGSPVRLGRGGMGTTYKAFDTQRRKHVALKVIGERLLADATSRRRFFNEARAASNLDHPNVVRVDYVCSNDAEECFYAMEWVDGESLGERVKNSVALPTREALLHVGWPAQNSDSGSSRPQERHHL
jgi:serine/threonine protein kinase